MGSSLGSSRAEVDSQIADWNRTETVRRLWGRDHTVWSPAPMPELTDRLGWLSLPQTMAASAEDLVRFGETVRDHGLAHVVLLGMGGSSLAPSVFRSAHGIGPPYPELIILDSTHPDAVRTVEGHIDLDKTIFVVSSKSGTTTETLSLFYYFWEKVGAVRSDRGQSFIAVTDPGTPFERMANDRSFLRVFRADPEVGGRYSALTHFGLVPAALIGVDIRRVLVSAAEMAELGELEEAGNPGASLGASLGTLALKGRNKLTFLTSRRLSEFASWAEQLIAESTGKDGKGIVPVVGEDVRGPDAYGPDRVFVRLELDGDEGEADRSAHLAALANAGHPVIDIRVKDPAEIGAEFFRWEMAIALAGAILRVNPFDQPDVQFAKDLAREAMEALVDGPSAGSGSDQESPSADSADAEQLQDAIRSWIGRVRAGDYVSVQAYVPQTGETTGLLQEARSQLHQLTRMATTVGYGPRFLHSTGQLHKGGPNNGLFLQLTDRVGTDSLPVPETDYAFDDLIVAQAAGDRLALHRKGRRVLRVDLGPDVDKGLRALNEVITATAAE